MDNFIRNYECYKHDNKPTISTWFYRTLYFITAFLMGWTIGGIILKTLGYDKSNWLHIFYPMVFAVLIWSIVLLYKLIKEILK